MLREDVMRFMTAHGMPTDLLLGGTVVLIVGAVPEIDVAGIEVIHAATPTAAGVLCGKRSVDVLVIDLAVGVATAADVLAVVRGERPGVAGVAVTTPDATADEIERASDAGFEVVNRGGLSTAVSALTAAAKRNTVIPSYRGQSSRKVVSQ